MAIRKFRNGKLNIYVDADDTVLESSKAVIEIINKRYNINPPKTIENLRKWNYTCIYSGITKEEVKDIYASTEFFDMVKPNPEFLKVYEKFKDRFNFIIVTKGDKLNLDLKENWFKVNFPEMYFIGIEFLPDKPAGFDKSVVNMRGSIQIDDRTDALKKTNAECKILLTNGRSYNWNQVKYGDNLYILNSWKEIGEVLEFTLKYPNWCSSFSEQK